VSTIHRGCGDESLLQYARHSGLRYALSRWIGQWGGRKEGERMRGFPLFCKKMLFPREVLVNALEKKTYVRWDFETNVIRVGSMSFTEEFLADVRAICEKKENSR
jgi:hypothetical protein